MDPIMREQSFLGLSAGGFHRVAYAEWGERDAARTAVCVHGLTRNGRDFDALAGALAAEGMRVACPDMVGRGRSGRLADPMGYGMPQYLQDMTALIARLGAGSIDWVGTSMGGILGMLLAAMPDTPIRRLVLNDVGPFIPKAPLAFIASYVGVTPTFASVEEVERHMRHIYAGFGRLSDAQWRHMATHEALPVAGGFTLGYDPGISVPIRAAPLADVDMWSVWDRIRCPVMVVRGASSDVLPAAVAAEMTRRGPGAEILEVPDAGHAPALMAADQIDAVKAFLRK
jgi:pimeloyl-ACP methyl ester carboxylesterase